MAGAAVLRAGTYFGVARDASRSDRDGPAGASRLNRDGIMAFLPGSRFCHG